jgi:hypothetical protein
MLWGGSAGIPVDGTYSIGIFSDDKGDKVDPSGIKGPSGIGTLAVPNPSNPIESIELGVTVIGDLISIKDAFEIVSGFSLGAKGQIGDVNIVGSPYDLIDIDFIIEALSPQTGETEPDSNTLENGFIDFSELEDSYNPSEK